MARTPQQTDKQVGHRIRMRRMMLRMSQTDLANKVGVTFQQVQKYESGTNRVSSGRLQQMARVLQVPVSYFFDGVTGGLNQGDTAKLEALLATSEGLSLVLAFKGIRDPKVRHQVLKLVEHLGLSS